MYVAPLKKNTSSDDGSDEEGDGSNVLNPSPFGRTANSRISSFSGSNVESEILEILDEWEEPELEQENLQVSRIHLFVVLLSIPFHGPHFYGIAL